MQKIRKDCINQKRYFFLVILPKKIQKLSEDRPTFVFVVTSRKHAAVAWRMAKH